MAVDKKITELDLLTGNIQNTDVSVLVRPGNDTDYKFTFTQLIAFMQAALSVGSVVTFNNSTPANNSGANGDVNIKPASGQFQQKVAGNWILQYTVPSAGTGTTIIYGLSAPNSGTGNNGDTYIQTDGGIFYQKSAGVWTQVFSMASGPAGATGATGAAGTNGTNGNTVLTGTTTPSNSTDGVNGDYYINKNTFYIYGPKAAGVWPAGVSLLQEAANFRAVYNYSLGDSRFVYDAVNYTLTFNLNTTDKGLFPVAVTPALNADYREIISAHVFKNQKSFEPIITDDGTFYTSVLFEGVTDPTIAQIVLY